MHFRKQRMNKTGEATLNGMVGKTSQGGDIKQRPERQGGMRTMGTERCRQTVRWERAWSLLEPGRRPGWLEPGSEERGPHRWARVRASGACWAKARSLGFNPESEPLMGF